MLTRKNAKAYAVLSIMFDAVNEDNNRLWVEPYLNGREEGFAVCVLTTEYPAPKVAFSENRNSDQIVMYSGVTTDFSMQGSTPNERAYEGRSYFATDDYVAAARAALDHLGIDTWL